MVQYNYDIVSTVILKLTHSSNKVSAAQTLSFPCMLVVQFLLNEVNFNIYSAYELGNQDSFPGDETLNSIYS